MHYKLAALNHDAGSIGTTVAQFCGFLSCGPRLTHIANLADSLSRRATAGFMSHLVTANIVAMDGHERMLQECAIRCDALKYGAAVPKQSFAVANIAESAHLLDGSAMTVDGNGCRAWLSPARACRANHLSRRLSSDSVKTDVPRHHSARAPPVVLTSCDY
jgi:hypothetical protein